tara:strand:+ start:45186 stop:46112 length:927 start_codon:yes stop_codon:yes gene_type:complete
MPNLDIVIVNWNSGRFIGECLNSIKNSNHENINKIIIIDNASKDNSLVDLPIFNKVEIHKNKINEGFAKACNLGSRYTKSEYILFLNPDTRVFKDTISDALEAIEKKPEVGILGVSLVDESNNIVKTCSRFLTPLRVFFHSVGLTKVFKSTGMAMLDWDHKTSIEVDQVMGAFFLTRRELFNQLEGFDETFFVYYEEMDFSLRASLRGYRSYYETSIAAYHYGGGTTENVVSQRLFYSLRSRIIYSFKHFKFFSCTQSVFSTLTLEMISRVLILPIIKLSPMEFVNSLKAYLRLYLWFIGYIFKRIMF